MKIGVKTQIQRTSSESSLQPRNRLKRKLVIVAVIAAIGVMIFFVSKSTPKPIPLRPGVATFTGDDSSTRGTWTGRYGNKGFSIANDAAEYPRWAEIAVAGEVATWVGSTDDQRALQRPGRTDRIASTWYGWSDVTVNVKFADESRHRLTLYCVDWDSTARVQTVEVLDSVSNTVLDTRTITGFNEGHYLSWDVSGSVSIRISRLAGANAVVSGLFID